MARGKSREKASLSDIDAIYNKVKAMNQRVRTMERSNVRSQVIDDFVQAQVKELGAVGEKLLGQNKTGNERLFGQGKKQIKDAVVETMKEEYDYKDEEINQDVIDRGLKDLRGKVNASSKSALNSPKKYAQANQERYERWWDHVENNPKFKDYMDLNDCLTQDEKDKIHARFIDLITEERKNKDNKDLNSSVVLNKAYQEVIKDSECYDEKEFKLITNKVMGHAKSLSNLRNRFGGNRE